MEGSRTESEKRLNKVWCHSTPSRVESKRVALTEPESRAVVPGLRGETGRCWSEGTDFWLYEE